MIKKNINIIIWVAFASIIAFNIFIAYKYVIRTTQYYKLKTAYTSEQEDAHISL